MLAARLRAIGQPLELVELPVPEPRGAELRIRVAGCGVCRTDLHILAGSQPRVALPRTLGHEVAGWIDAFGPHAARSLPLGEPVVVFGGWGCGTCRECLAGEEQRCSLGASPGFQRDGGYAEFMLVPDARHLVPLGSLDPVRAAPLADAGVTPFRAVRRARPWLTPGARVLLIGFGALGQFAAQYLPPGCVVSVRDLDPRKVELARSFGAVPLDGPADRAADVVFDFVGTSETLASAADAVAPGGLISLVGEGGGTLPFSFESPAVEASVTTTAWGSLQDLRSVVVMAPQLRWDVEVVPLRDAAAALDRLALGDVSGRLVLVPGPGPG
jgi:propanol-preferring alcohol dehydrogenase